MNQKDLVNYYLASDVVVLPSRRSGETWGLVVNEALQVGCSVVVIEGVGCGSDFVDLESFLMISIGSALKLGEELSDLFLYSRSFDWASVSLEKYSIDAASQPLVPLITDLF
ncbi:glycosyltransferase [Synechococcus sp. MIT S9501]|uniref:glycosyltransferase n=1 Tax=Synechococcus sp. MIT S9501 TaxID=3082545 RepID=UPI0039B4AC37